MTVQHENLNNFFYFSNTSKITGFDSFKRYITICLTLIIMVCYTFCFPLGKSGY